MLQRASHFAKLTSQRAFGAAATRHQSQHVNFTRSDLGEFPELNRSFMKVLDSGVDTESPEYIDNYRMMLEKNLELD